MRELLRFLLVTSLLKPIKSKVINIGYICKFESLRLGRSVRLRAVNFEPHVTVGDGCSIEDCSVGELSYFSANCSFFRTNIGRYVCIGPNVRCGLGTHPSRDFVSIHPAFYSTARQAQITYVSATRFQESAPVCIGNDVWIGANAILMDGVSVGDGAIIAAGAVVTKNVEPYAIAAGVPAKIIRKRFKEDEIEEILSKKWWTWGSQKIRDLAPQFVSLESLNKMNELDKTI